MLNITVVQPTYIHQENPAENIASFLPEQLR